jgi:4'-phosphopantetheinyl transferase
MRDANSRPRDGAPVTGSWRPGPLRPRLGPGDLHVWRADLAGVSDGILELLTEEESERSDRLAAVRARHPWPRSRGVLRALLGRYLDIDPRGLRLSTSANGKPELLDTHGPREGFPASLSFNLSHSGEIALYAFSTIGAVGIDVELARREIDAVALARRALSPDEATRIAALAKGARETAFLRAWSRQEAILKCSGAGLTGGLTTAQPSMSWWTELDVGPGAGATVAVVEAPRDLFCWAWTG